MKRALLVCLLIVACCAAPAAAQQGPQRLDVKVDGLAAPLEVAVLLTLLTFLPAIS